MIAPKALFARLLAAALIIAVSQPAVRAETVDPTTTGSVNATGAIGESKGSASFRRVLKLLDDNKWVDAYEAAKVLGNDHERRAIQWAAIYFGDGAIDQSTVLRFAADAPDYAADYVYKTRLEQALAKRDPGKDEVIRLLGGEMPRQIDAQILLASAYLADGQRDRAARIARSIWTGNFLAREQEDSVRQKLGSLLSRQDHWDRAVMLLMHDRARGTERLLDYLTPAQKSLALARIAVARNAGNAQALIDRVDPGYRTHAMFYFSRAQLAEKKGALEAALKFLDSAPADRPEEAEWWYERRTLSRKLLAAGNIEAAYKAAANYQGGPEGRVVDANFHAGWIALIYMNDARRAAGHFAKMRSLSTLPDSIASSNYWEGRALLAMGDQAGASARFSTAAQFGTIYYGLLAREALGQHGVSLRGLPDWQHAQPIFEARGTVRSARLLAANGHARLAEPLVRRIAFTLNDPGELVLAARLAQDIGAHNEAIIIADFAERKGVSLDLFNFPKDGIPGHFKLAEIDKAAVYAVARQESRFDIDAISRAGARGMMQLMPATAEETARKLGVGYSKSRLTKDAAYNALLGSAYLARQLSYYDGSLVLAAAAYNAGAGNVNKWLKTYGDPRSDRIDAVAWVETIPFAETRKYVQRVLANYLVYRARLGDNNWTMGRALRRIPQ